MRILLLSALLSLPMAPALAQSEYGGGWAVPSLDTAISIANDVIRSEIVTEVGMRSIGRDKQGRPLNEAAPRPPGGSGAVAGPGERRLFASALEPAAVEGQPVRTRFVRSTALQKKSEAAILAEVGRRQPGAKAEYARVFATQDMARLFDRATAAYGLRNDDVADTMAAYWLVSWVIATNARDFSAAAARAVRDQVRRGMARTTFADPGPEQQQRLADHAIFNTLIATQAFEYAQSGKISRTDYRRIADATQNAFLGLGVDLRSLQLTDAGFVRR